MPTSSACERAEIAKDWIPDPSSSLFRLYVANDDRARGRAWIRQRRRRSDIFAAARSLMEATGYDGVQMQAIAAQCDISPQTIYNLVGTKADVMEQAASDWVESIRVSALRRAAEVHVTSAFLIIEMFWVSALRYADWVRIASKSSSVPGDPLNRAFYISAKSALSRELQRLESLGALRGGVDVDSLARQLTATSHISICNWCAQPTSVASYRRDLISGPGAMLRAWLHGPDLSRLERYLDAAAVAHSL
jgi:AcrR family transcriptional regulator